MDPNRRRLKATPIHPLSTSQRRVFNETYMRHSHLVPGDAVLISTYAIVVSRLDAVRKAKSPKVSDLDKLSRLIVALSRALRLAPQSRTDPKTLSRREVNNKYTWNHAEDDDENEAG
jgi:hypothetical protein